jgi:hypothetical protein
MRRSYANIRSVSNVNTAERTGLLDIIKTNVAEIRADDGLLWTSSTTQR